MADETSSSGPAEPGKSSADSEFEEQPTLIGAGPTEQLEPGTLLFGEYEIVGPLGEGAMGEVYRARHRDLHSLRAIKVMHAGLDRRREALDLFLHEAQALLKVHHDAVVACHDMLRDDRGRFYLIMELIEGRSLLSMMRQQPLPELSVWALGERLASGLAAAHGCGVVHRDLSPDNVLLPDGEPARAKLIDFGLAKHLVEGDRTIITGFKGKLGYASPEQLGLHGGHAGPRSDVYSLALVLAAAASGKPLPMGRTLAEAIDRRRLRPELSGAVSSRSLRKALETLLEPDPDARLDALEVVELFRKQAPLSSARSALVGPLRRRFSVGFTLRIAFALLVLAGTGSLVRQSLLMNSVRTEGSASEAPAAVPEPFDQVREQLLAVLPGEASASVWTSPGAVAEGSAYVVGFRADCACEALLFSVGDAGEEIVLLYPNSYEPARRLVPGEAFVIPSNPAYELEAVGAGERDTLILVLRHGAFGFPPMGFGGGSHLWSTTREAGDEARIRELAAILEGDLAGSARTLLRVVDAEGTH